MIKVHFFLDLNRELKRYEFPLSFVGELCEQYDRLDVPQEAFSQVDILAWRLRHLKILIDYMNNTSFCADPKILNFRFATKTVVAACLSRREQSPPGSVPIYFKFEADEPEKRLGFVGGLFREASYWLNVYLLREPGRGNIFTEAYEISRDLLTSDYRVGGKHSVIDEAFEDFRQHAKDLDKRKTYRSNLYLQLPESGVDDALPPSYLEEGPSFFRRFEAILAIDDFEIVTLGEALLALVNSCAEYEIPQGHTITLLICELLNRHECFFSLAESEAVVMADILEIYQRLKKENESCENPNFIDHDWCESIAMVHYGIKLAYSDSEYGDYEGRIYPADTDDIDVSVEEYVENLIRNLELENFEQKVWDWMESSGDN